MIFLLQIEEDGHIHGHRPPKPWVAEITGLHERYGLSRVFVKGLRDYRDARVAWSGNTYGVVATFPLRDGRLYEVSRCEGKSSKRLVTRRFYLVEDGQMHEKTPEEVLAWLHGEKAA